MQPTKTVAQILRHIEIIAAAKAQPAIFRAALVSAMNTRRATVGNYLQAYDPAKVGALATLGAEAAAIESAIAIFDAIPCDNRGRQAADQHCRESVETIAGLLLELLSSLTANEPAKRAELAKEFARLSGELLRADIHPDELYKLENDAAQVRIAADNLTLSIAGARNAIIRYKNVGDCQSFEDAHRAVQAVVI